jgi:hypothetical protein
MQNSACRCSFKKLPVVAHARAFKFTVYLVFIIFELFYLILVQKIVFNQGFSDQFGPGITKSGSERVRYT